MFSNNFVAAIMVNGKSVERKRNGEIQIPFGTEYSIKLHNKHDKRAVAKIEIDGENVSEGGIVVPANGHIEVKRNTKRDEAFKLVDLNSEEAHSHGKGGDNKDRKYGTISIKFFLEKTYQYYDFETIPARPEVKPWPTVKPYPFWPNQWNFGSDNWSYASGPSGSVNDFAYGAMSTPPPGNAQPMSFNDASGMSFNEPQPLKKKLRASSNRAVKDGCTVGGSETGQKFHTVHLDTVGEYTEIQFFLRGYAHKAPKNDYQTLLADIEVEYERLSQEVKNEERRICLERENEKLRKQLEELRRK